MHCVEVMVECARCWHSMQRVALHVRASLDACVVLSPGSRICVRCMLCTHLSNRFSLWPLDERSNECDCRAADHRVGEAVDFAHVGWRRLAQLCTGCLRTCHRVVRKALQKRCMQAKESKSGKLSAWCLCELHGRNRLVVPCTRRAGRVSVDEQCMHHGGDTHAMHARGGVHMITAGRCARMSHARRPRHAPWDAGHTACNLSRYVAMHARWQPPCTCYPTCFEGPKSSKNTPSPPRPPPDAIGIADER